MSFTCTVLYGTITKKVQCPISFSVNQLVQLSIEKFKLVDTFGELSSGGKKLDPLLPIRLTSLTNNAKLTLTLSNSDVIANLKIIGSIEGEPVISTIKISAAAPIANLLNKFAALNDIKIDLETKRVSLSVLQSSVENSTSDFKTTLLRSILGNSSNAVVRLVVEDKNVYQLKRKLQEEQTKIRLQMEEEKRQTRSMRKEETSDISIQPGPSSQLHPNSPPLTSIMAPEENEIAPKTVVDRVAENKQPPKVQATASTGETLQILSLNTKTEDTVYVPLNRTELYDNPEDDYDMTPHQAEKYLNMIKSMQAKPKTKKLARPPRHYSIRLRFPDRSLVQFHLDDPNIKLGQLVKKIDSFVDIKFINSYRIRNGSPPFKEIHFDFDANNASMNRHPEFQEEKLLLIWEPTTSQPGGPYLKSDVSTKDVNELSTMRLEAHRGQLEDDESTAEKRVEGNKEIRSSKFKLTTKTPKWFRP